MSLGFGRCKPEGKCEIAKEKIAFPWFSDNRIENVSWGINDVLRLLDKVSNEKWPAKFLLYTLCSRNIGSSSGALEGTMSGKASGKGNMIIDPE